jgi:hypothetical protein
MEPTWKRKAYSYLVSFAEDREEFLQKLQLAGYTEEAFLEALLRDLFPAYNPDDLSVSVVAHSDTEHFHYHITVLNQRLDTGRSLYVPGGKNQARRHELLREKWELVLGLNPGEKRLLGYGRPGLKKILEELASKDRLVSADRQALKEELTALASYFVAEGLVSSRDDLVDLLAQELGWEVKRKGPHYVSFETPAGRIRLKGGVWSNADFERIKAGVGAEAEGVETDNRARLARIREELAELDEWFERSVTARYGRKATRGTNST